MMNSKILYIVIIVLVLAVIGGGIFLLSNKGAQKETGEGQSTTTSPSTEAQAPATGEPTSATDQEMVDCSGATDPSCFLARMSGCLPVTTKMTGSDGATAIEVTILGIENEKCHFQRKVNNVIDLNCLFPKGTLNMDSLDQTFGNDHGAEAKKVVDEACTQAGW